jgi:hypothetical protein
VVVAGQAPFAVTGVVSGAVVGSAIPAVGVGRKDALQPPEAIVVRRVDEVITRPADRRVEQVTVLGPAAEQERRRPVGVFRVRAAVAVVGFDHRARQVVKAVRRDRVAQGLVDRVEKAAVPQGRRDR